jgi:hypothetical protein
MGVSDSDDKPSEGRLATAAAKAAAEHVDSSSHEELRPPTLISLSALPASPTMPSKSCVSPLRRAPFFRTGDGVQRNELLEPADTWPSSESQGGLGEGGLMESSSPPSMAAMSASTRLAEVPPLTRHLQFGDGGNEDSDSGGVLALLGTFFAASNKVERLGS